MTTIAYRDGVLAADSLFTAGSLIETKGNKLYRLASGVLVGISGDHDCREFFGLLKDVKKPEDLPSRKALLATKDDVGALVVFPSRQVFYVANEPDKTAEVIRIKTPYAAAGSGARVALGAMAAGANAVRAVHIGCKHDSNSRPPVRYITLRGNR